MFNRITSLLFYIKLLRDIFLNWKILCPYLVLILGNHRHKNPEFVPPCPCFNLEQQFIEGFVIDRLCHLALWLTIVLTNHHLLVSGMMDPVVVCTHLCSGSFFCSLTRSDWNRCKIGWLGQDCSRQNNLRFEGIKEHENESWEDCKTKTYNLLENRLEMDIENVVEQASKHIEPGRKKRIDYDL